MNPKGFVNQQVYGEALIVRLARSPHAAALKKETKVFATAQSGYGKACEKVAVAQAKRDDALSDIGEADTGLDKALLALANRMVGAGLGTRQKPFADYSPHSPSRLTDLAYAEEVKETLALLGKLRKKKLSAEVLAAVKAVADAAAKVTAALKAYAGPQAGYEAAMQARDGLLLDWNKALSRLKRAAAVAYDEDKAGYRALFAPAQDLQIKKRPPKKKTPPPGPATPAS